MSWYNDRYSYSIRTLRTIATNYRALYDGLPLSENSEVTDMLGIAEFKADFDVALESIGTASWSGIIGDRRRFTSLQLAVINDILGQNDYSLENKNYFAYQLMRRKLNGER